MCLAIVGTWWLNFNLHNKRELDFRNKADRIAIEIERRFSTPLYALKGTKSLFGVTQTITQEQFQNALKSRDLENEFRGMRGIGFVEAVEDHRLSQYIAEQKPKQTQSSPIKVSMSRRTLFTTSPNIS